MDVNNFKFKHSNRIEIRYCLLGQAQTAQWQHCKVTFMLAMGKVFWKKNLSVANSHQKCFRFPNCNNVFCANVQQYNNQFQKLEIFTANCKFIWEVFLHFKTSSKTVIVDIRSLLKISRTKSELENKKWNSKVKLTKSTFGQKFVLQKFETTEGLGLESDVCIWKHEWNSYSKLL